MTGYERLLHYLPASATVTSRERYTRPHRLLRWIAEQARHPRYSTHGAGLELAALSRIVRLRPDHVHFLYGEYDMHYSPEVCRRLRVTCTAAFHNPPDELRRRLHGGRFLDSLSGAVLLGSSQRALFASEFPHVPTQVIHHGVDTDYFSPPVRTEDARDGAPVALLVGIHLRDWELTRRFLYAAKRAIPTLRAQCIIPAEHVGHLPREDWISNSHPVTDEQLREHYRKATFLFYSPVECVASNAVVEALACGLPVVAPRVGDVAEYVGDGTGYLLERDDLDSMVEAARLLCEDATVRSRLSTQARSHILDYSWSRIGQRYLEFFDRISAFPASQLEPATTTGPRSRPVESAHEAVPSGR